MACRRIDEYITLSQILKKHLTEHLRARSGPIACRTVPLNAGLTSTLLVNLKNDAIQRYEELSKLIWLKRGVALLWLPDIFMGIYED
jgi:hypothetical protein